jgi:hypothetical protein
MGKKSNDHRQPSDHRKLTRAPLQGRGHGGASREMVGGSFSHRVVLYVPHE